MNVIPAISEFATGGGPDRDPSAPAFVVDIAAHRLVSANGAAVAAWGAPAAPAGGHALDAAMPALATLAALPPMQHGWVGPMPLVFWTAVGVARWSCLVRRAHDEAGRDLALVVVPEGAAVDCEAAAAALRAAPARSERRPPCPIDGDGLARLAHELRTPLSAILSMADVIAEERFGPVTNDRYLEYARTVSDTARHAIGVVSAMLDAEPGDDGRAEPTFTELDLNALASEAVRSMERLVRSAEIDLSCALERGLPRVIADRVSVSQIVLNLLSNAIAHAGGGARVVVRSGRGPGGDAWLEVEDDGPGVPAEVASALEAGAERLASTSVGAGHGMGLPLARSLALRNGARLAVARAEPHGARLRLTFTSSRTVPV